MKREPEIEKFDKPDYLSCGTEDQRTAYRLLSESNIFTILHEFSPILTGTYPIGIQVPGSDLDIICEVCDKERFIEVLTANFSAMEGFTWSVCNQNGADIVLAGFLLKGMEFEVFGQNKPVKEQNAYIHMINEYRMLCRYGEDFRMKVIELKRSGLKTEPAFARLLNLEGDPYQAMLRIE